VFPSKDLIVDGKQCIPGGRTFFFDLESYEGCDIRSFGEIYAGSDNVKEVIKSFGDDFIFGEFSDRLKRLESFFKIYKGIDYKTVIAKTPVKGEILNYYKSFNILLDKIFQRSSKQNYKFMREERRLVETIARRKLNLDQDLIGPGDVVHDRIIYDIYRGSTGRFITKGNSFPILNIAKEKRGILRPTNQVFVMVDQRCADFRAFLYTFAKDKREYELVEDLYEDIEGATRAEKKQTVGRLMYSHNRGDGLIADLGVLNQIYGMIYKETDDAVTLLSPKFKRELVVKKSEENIDNLLIAHLIQSLTNDVAVEACFKIESILKNTESFIAFTIHDAIILDMTIDDYQNYFEGIKKTIEETRLGHYYWKSYMGYNFGDMYHESDFDWEQH